MTRGGAAAARRAHNPKVAGSSPAPATKLNRGKAPIYMGAFPFKNAESSSLGVGSQFNQFSGFGVGADLKNSNLSESTPLFWKAWAARVNHENALVFLNDGIVGVPENNDVNMFVEYGLKCLT